MSPKVNYTQKSLSAEDTQALIDGGKLTELATFLGSGDPSVEKIIPTSAKKNGKSSFIRLDQLKYYQSPDEQKAKPAWFRSIYFVHVTACSKSDCKKEQKAAREKGESLAAWRVLESGIEIAKIYTGDVNKDGYNDVLVQMSDGAGLMFYSKKIVYRKAPQAIEFSDGGSEKPKSP